MTDLVPGTASSILFIYFFIWTVLKLPLLLHNLSRVDMRRFALQDLSVAQASRLRLLKSAHSTLRKTMGHFLY